MANSTVLSALAAPVPSSSPARLATSATLAAALPGQRVRITQIAQDEDLAAWLRAVGMHEETEMTVLRRAPFDGPIHLRTSDGGEFAIHRDLARCIQVALVDARTPPRGSGEHSA